MSRRKRKAKLNKGKSTKVWSNEQRRINREKLKEGEKSNLFNKLYSNEEQLAMAKKGKTYKDFSYAYLHKAVKDAELKENASYLPRKKRDKFYVWLQKHKLVNTHRHMFLNEVDIPHMMPIDTHDIKVQKKDWKSLQKALNIKDAKQSEKAFKEATDKIVEKAIKQGKKFGIKAVENAPDITNRGITGFRTTPKTGIVYKYKKAALARNNKILAWAVNKGGTAFCDYLFDNDFRWNTFYRNDAKSDYTTSESEAQFRVFCEEHLNSSWKSLLNECLKKYQEERSS